jgi:hypothetical protein
MVTAAFAVFLLTGAGSASASTTHDLTGTWECCGAGGAGHQFFEITTMSQQSGSFSGQARTSPTGNPFSPITGTANGDSVSLTTGPYNGSSYSATFTGTIAASNNSMAGSWTSNAGQSGTWTATRTSGPNGPPICTARATASAAGTPSIATCSNPSGPPSLCGPGGTIFPQCYLPVTLPEVCGPSNTILVACQSQGPYIVACGGFGTVLPPCNLPPPQLPQVCGPSNTILPPCTGANNPVLVCGPSNTILPQCNFGGPIHASPLGDGATISQSNLCNTELLPGGKKGKCDVLVAIEAMSRAAKTALDNEAVGRSRSFLGRISDCQASPGRYAGLTSDQCSQAGRANAAAFVSRTQKLTGQAFPNSGLPQKPLDQADTNRLAVGLKGKIGPPPYTGPDLLWQGVNGNTIEDQVLYNAPGLMAESIARALLEVSEVSGQIRNSNQDSPLKTFASISKKKGGSKKPLVLKSLKLKPGKHTRVRIPLSRKVVRKLAKAAGKPRHGRRYVAVRLTVMFKTTPMPVARFYDLRIPVKH